MTASGCVDIDSVKKIDGFVKIFRNIYVILKIYKKNLEISNFHN